MSGLGGLKGRASGVRPQGPRLETPKAGPLRPPGVYDSGRVRYVVLATFVGLLALACRRDRPASEPGGTPATTTIAPAAPALAGAEARPATVGPSGISDGELVAFVRWRREYAQLLGQQQARMEVITTDDPSKPFDELVKERVREAAEVTARFAPIIRAHHARQPLHDERYTLAEEATGGLFHFRQGPTGALLIVARDEERIGAARRRFGAARVDDILARESLILAEVQRP